MELRENPAEHAFCHRWDCRSHPETNENMGSKPITDCFENPPEELRLNCGLARLPARASLEIQGAA